MTVNNIIDNGREMHDNVKLLFDIDLDLDITSDDYKRKFISRILSASNCVWNNSSTRPTTCLLSKNLIQILDDAYEPKPSNALEYSQPGRILVGTLAGLKVETSSLITTDTVTLFVDNDDIDKTEIKYYYTFNVSGTENIKK